MKKILIKTLQSLIVIYFLIAAYGDFKTGIKSSIGISFWIDFTVGLPLFSILYYNWRCYYESKKNKDES